MRFSTGLTRAVIALLALGITPGPRAQNEAPPRASASDLFRTWASATDELPREACARRLESEVSWTPKALSDFEVRCKGAGWRGEVLWLRVASMQGAVDDADWLAGLSHVVAPVRAIAARLLMDTVRRRASDPARDVSPPLVAAVRGALLDEDHDVRSAAIDLSLDLGILRPKDLDRMLAANDDRDLARRAVRSAPRTFSTLADRWLTERDDALPWILEDLEGAWIAPSTRDLVIGIAKDESIDDALRLRACVLCDVRGWPKDIDALLLRGLAANSEIAEQLLSFLEPAVAARIVGSIIESDDTNLAVRGVRALERADEATLLSTLDRVNRLVPEARAHALRILEARIPGPGTERAIREIENAVDIEVKIDWLAAFGKRIASSHEGRMVLLRTLEASVEADRPDFAKLAFLTLITEGSSAKRLVAFVRRHPVHLRVFSQSRLDVPQAFWIDMLRAESESAETSYVAIRALSQYAQTPEIAAALRRVLSNDPKRSVRAAALRAYLSVPKPLDLESTLSIVVRSSIAELDDVLVESLETNKRDYVPAALDLLATTRFAARLQVAHAIHGDDEAARRLLARFESLDGAKLRRLRSAFARVLNERDFDHLFGVLARTSDGDPFKLSEVFEWFALRSREFGGEGPACLDARLREFVRHESDPELITAARALLVRRGHLDVLEACLDRWVLQGNEDDEGLLLELLGALPNDAGRRGALLAFRICAAPVQRGLSDLLEQERETSLIAGRIETIYPAIPPIVAWMTGQPRAVLERAFDECLADPARHDLWKRFPVEAKARLLQVAARGRVALGKLATIVAEARETARAGTVCATILGMFEARIAAEAGEWERALRAFEPALRDLESLQLTERNFEVVVRDTLPTSVASPRAAIRAFGLALRSRCTKDEDAAAALRDTARLTLRGDVAFANRIL
ncbi:MAG: hypothetical protein KDC95_04610 [Planctomycetes bacterium]|nr:hypothetical protein [Planctomycetota bacterium]